MNKFKLFLVLFFALVFIFFLKPFEGTGDFYHHVNTGRYIIENKTLPHLDTYSHTAFGLPWVAHSWLSGLLFYLLLENLGKASISLFSAGLATLTFVLIYHLLRLNGASKMATILTMALVAIPISTRWPQRPELFTYPLVVSFLLIDALKTKYPKVVWLFPLLMVLWANLYGSGLLFGLLLLGYLVVKQFISDRFRFKKEFRLFYLLSFISYLLSFLNGYGFHTIFYFYLYIPKVSVYEGEWSGIFRILSTMPLSQLVSQQYLILLYFIILLTTIVVLIFSWKVIKQNLFLTALALSIFAPILVFRQVPLASILISPILALALTYHLKKHHFFLVALPIISLITSLTISLWLNPPRIKSYENSSATEMIQFIKTQNLKGNAFNQNHLGGYLTYNLYPQVLVFFDTRDDLYVDTEALKDLYETFNKNQSVLSLLDKYKIDLVIADYLTDGMNYRDLFYSLDWSLVYLNDRYFLFVPAEVAKQKSLTELKALDPYSPSAAKSGQEKEAAKYYQELQSKNPDSLNNKLFLASSLLKLEQYDQVLNLASSIEIDPKSLAGPIMERDRNFLLAETYLAKNDCQKSKEFLDKSSIDVDNVFFLNNPQLVSKVDKGWAMYFAICQKNAQKTTEHLYKYFSSGQITPLEKTQLIKQIQEILPDLKIR